MASAARLSARWGGAPGVVVAGRRCAALGARPLAGTAAAAGALRSAALQPAWAPQARRGLSSLPPHVVVGLPALSPTMSMGNLSKWRVKVSDVVKPGTVLAEIETDKATVDFESQDDGVVAKLLVPEGAKDLAVGAPIAVFVENAADVPKFKDFEAKSGAPAAAAAAAPAAAKPAPASAPAPAPAAPATATAPTPAAAAKAPAAAATAAPKARPASSALETVLAAERNAYSAKYGPTLLWIPPAAAEAAKKETAKRA